MLRTLFGCISQPGRAEMLSQQVVIAAQVVVGWRGDQLDVELAGIRWRSRAAERVRATTAGLWRRGVPPLRPDERQKQKNQTLKVCWWDETFFFCFTARRSWVQIQDIYGVKCTTLDNFKKKDQNRLTDQIWVFNKYTMPAGDSFFLLHWHFIWMNLESWNRRNSSRLMDHQSDLYKKSNWWTLALMQSVRQLIPLWAPAER